MLQEINGVKDTSDVRTPTAASPDTPTPVPATRTNSGLKPKNLLEPTPQRPSSPFRTTSFQKMQDQNARNKRGVSYEDQLSPTSVPPPAKLEAALLDEKAGLRPEAEKGIGDLRAENPMNTMNEPHFLRTESVGGTEHRSNSVIIDKSNEESMDVDGNMTDGSET